MLIKEITRYELQGKEFTRLQHVKTHVENQLGAILDEIFNICPPAQAQNKLKVLEFISKKDTREKLTFLLNITFEQGEETLDGRYINNILDL